MFEFNLNLGDIWIIHNFAMFINMASLTVYSMNGKLCSACAEADLATETAESTF